MVALFGAGKKLWWTVTGTVSAIIVLVAMARVYRGAHWATDVTASVLWATLFLLAVEVLYTRFHERFGWHDDADGLVARDAPVGDELVDADRTTRARRAPSGRILLVLPVVTVDQMQAIDAGAPEPTDVLIDRAGGAVARAAVELLGGAYGRRVVVVAGPGNNGADGRSAAAELRRRGATCTVIELADAPRRLPDADLVIDAALGTGISRPYEAPDPGRALGARRRHPVGRARRHRRGAGRTDARRPHRDLRRPEAGAPAR